jgi:nucleoside-diphosphate-sugar epimerase
VLVTGAGGYIGGAVAASLAGSGHRVQGVVRSTHRVVELQACGVEPIQLDLRELGQLAELADGVRLVVHCAFGATRPSEVAAAIELERRATRMLLAARSTVVYTSGIGVLAGGPAGRTVPEDYVPSADAPLAWRHELERLVTDAGGRVVRPALVYGRGGNRILTDLIAQSAARAAAGYVGDGDGALPTVHIDDLTDAYVRVATEGRDGAVYTVLAQTTTPRAIATAIGELLGVPVRPATEATMRSELPALEWIAGDLRVDAPRIRDELGWRPGKEPARSSAIPIATTAANPLIADRRRCRVGLRPHISKCASCASHGGWRETPPPRPERAPR